MTELVIYNKLILDYQKWSWNDINAVWTVRFWIQIYILLRLDRYTLCKHAMYWCNFSSFVIWIRWVMGCGKILHSLQNGRGRRKQSCSKEFLMKSHCSRVGSMRRKMVLSAVISWIGMLMLFLLFKLLACNHPISCQTGSISSFINIIAEFVVFEKMLNWHPWALTSIY